VTGRRGRRPKQLLDDLKGKKRILEIERGSTRSQSVENSIWNRLGSCRMTNNTMSEFVRCP